MPKPWIILIFTFIIVTLSLLMGFTGATDNWAHIVSVYLQLLVKQTFI